MAGHNELGIYGEEIAVRYLQERSYVILERNWRCRRLEVDIIARIGDKVVIAEVKTRTDGFMESLGKAVNKRKQDLLIRAANAYIAIKNLDLDVRFDIITVIFEGKTKFQVQHIENAFFPVVRN
jgi:putative endonuclease